MSLSAIAREMWRATLSEPVIIIRVPDDRKTNHRLCEYLHRTGQKFAQPNDEVRKLLRNAVI